MIIMQGDAYYVPIDIEQDGVTLTPEMISDIEISVGSIIRKTYSGGDVQYSDGQWYFRLSQTDTLDLESGVHYVQTRVKYLNRPEADVFGIVAGAVSVIESNSKEVL